MRVAIVVRSLKLGGMERAAVNLAEAFAAQGHDAHLLYFKDKHRELSPDKRVRVHHFDLDRSMRRSPVGFGWELLSRLLNALVRRSYFYWSGFVLSRLFTRRLRSLEAQTGTFDLIIARGQGTFETLWNVNDPRLVQVVESMFLFPGKALQNFYLRRIYDGKNVVCVSPGVQEHFIQTAQIAGFAPRRLETITNPLDIAAVRQLSTAYTPEVDAPYLLSVGRITPNKNLSLLIDGYLLFRSRTENPPQLVIVGDGHDRPSIEAKIAKAGAGAFIHLLGKKENPYPWMRHAALFMLSSKYEGLGMVLIEAMACGTKVISTKAPGGVPSIMTGALEAYLCDFTPQSFADKIAFALAAPTPDYTQQLSAFAPEKVVAQFIAFANETASKT